MIKFDVLRKCISYQGIIKSMAWLAHSIKPLFEFLLSNTSIRQFLLGFIFLSYYIKAFHFLCMSSSLGYLVMQRKTYGEKYLKQQRNDLFRKGENIAVRQGNCSLNFFTKK